MRAMARRYLPLLHASESGMAMMIALAVVFMLSLVTAALVNLAISEYSTAATADRSNQAFLAAQAGAERTIAVLRADADWSDNATTGAWATFPDPGSLVPQVGQYRVSLQPIAGSDPTTNMRIRSVGQVRGATRTVEFDLHRLSGGDFTTYSIHTVDITNISGGGSLQWHGSAYFEDSLVLRGGAQAGFYNDRKVESADSDCFNNLYVHGTLDLSVGNPTIGTRPNPYCTTLQYWWVHVSGNIIGASLIGTGNFNVTNVDSVVPPPFYPDLLGAARSAFAGAGNVLALQGGQETLVVCSRTGSSWVTRNTTSLVLTVSEGAFFLPRAGSTCANFSTYASITALRNDTTNSNYMLLWDPQPLAPATTNLVLRNEMLPTYIPGQVLVGQDIVYEGKGSIVAGNQPGATTPAGLSAQSTIALNLNVNATCTSSNLGACSTSSQGQSMKARISPCLGQPGADNPSTTFPRTDIAALFVNGSAYSDLQANSCSQEFNLVAVVGDRASPLLQPVPSYCPRGDTDVRAHFAIQKQLQWYGILMARQMCLSQVPDFWQMPDLTGSLPRWARQIIVTPNGPVEVRNWRELF